MTQMIQEVNNEMLKMKDLSRINSPFKLQFIPSVIAQFEQQLAEDAGFASQFTRLEIAQPQPDGDSLPRDAVRVHTGNVFDPGAAHAAEYHHRRAFPVVNDHACIKFSFDGEFFFDEDTINYKLPDRHT